jgi:hypothetical protein
MSASLLDRPVLHSNQLERPLMEYTALEKEPSSVKGSNETKIVSREASSFGYESHYVVRQSKSKPYYISFHRVWLYSMAIHTHRHD